MQIRLLSSHSSVLRTGTRTPSRPHHPSHLPNDLCAALREKGHRVQVNLLGDALDGRELTTLRQGAVAGRKLAAELTDADAGGVLHALDTVAWAAALTARSLANVAVVLRFTGSADGPGAASPARPVDRAPAEPGLDPPISLTERRARQACLRAADAVAAIADEGRTAAVRVGVRSDRAVVVPDLVGTSGSWPQPGIRAPGSELVSLSGIGPDSGVDTALAALRRLPGRHLAVAGPGDESHTETFRARLRGLGLEERVRWLGWLDRPATAALIDSSALLLCPSPTSGAVGAIEAMARSRAVVAVTGGRAAAIVVDGVTGHVLPADRPDLFGTRLRALLNNPFQLEAMGHAGRERAHTLFAPDRVVDATEHAYRIALGAA
jgi:glycosyltransferase involved in cell wall biosynthesis